MAESGPAGLGVGTTTASAAALDVLAACGVDRVFGNPGTTELPLIKEFATHDCPRYVLVPHEGAAVSAAAGHALSTGQPGVSIVHAMPGLANGLSMYYNAWRAGVPLVLIAGTQDRRMQYLNPVLHADLTDVARAVSKSVWEVRTADEIPDVLAQALQHAATNPSGPVFLAVPIDLWIQPVSPGPPQRPACPVTLGPAPDRAIADLRDFLLDALNPVLVTGDLAGRHECGGLLAELGELLGAPAYWAPQPTMASFPSTSRCYRGAIMADAQSFARAFGQGDALLTVGANVGPSVLFECADLIPPAVRTATITETPADPVGLVNPQLSLYGDVSATLAHLISTIQGRLESDAALDARIRERRSTVLEEGARRKERNRSRTIQGSPDRSPLHPSTAVAAILDAAPDRVVVIDEAVSNSGWVSRLGSFTDSLSYLTLARGGALGYAVGMAIGATTGSGRPGLVILGDGALTYAPQGLWTAANADLPIVTCVLNNGGYQVLTNFSLSEHFNPGYAKGELTQDDIKEQIEPLQLREPPIDFVALAQSFGVDAVRVDTAPELQNAIATAFRSGRPRLIDVPIISTKP